MIGRDGLSRSMPEIKTAKSGEFFPDAGSNVNVDWGAVVLPMLTAVVLAHFITLAMLSILYFNYLLFGDYFWTILWAVLISEALQSAKGVVLWGIQEISSEERRQGTSLIVAAVQVISEGLRTPPSPAQPSPRSPNSARSYTPKLKPGIVLEHSTPKQEYLTPRSHASSTNVGHGNASHGTALAVRALLGLAIFSGASFFSLMTHLVPWWLLLGGFAAMCVPILLLITLLDRRIFMYRHVISDNSLATLMVICVFFLCSSFIVLFLGTESVFEGLTVAQRASKWVTSVMENQEIKNALSQHITKGEETLRDALASMEATYNGTLWWGPAQDAINNYMEHGTPLGFREVSWVEQEGEEIDNTYKKFINGLDTENMSFWQVLQSFRSNLESWNISISDIFVAIGHAQWGGKKMANISLKVVQGLLVVLAFMLSMGFKTILFFSVLWYVLSQESLIERLVRDLLPIPADKKNEAVRTLRQSIEGVFFSIPTIACFHGIITLASFTALSIEFPFFSTFLSVIFSLLPIVDPYLVCLPWVFACIFNGEWAKGIALFVLQYVVSSFVAKQIINTGVPQCSEFLTYLTVLSIFMGFAVFGMQGVFAGPLVLVLGRLVFLSLDALTSSSETSWSEIIMRYPMRNVYNRPKSNEEVED